MAKSRFVNTHFWDDTYIVELDSLEKLLFLYLITNPCTDICGAYEISLRRIALDTGIDKDMVLKIIERFTKANKISYKDGWIVVHNFIKNQADNPSVRTGILRSLSNCPDWVKRIIGEPVDRLSQPGTPNLIKPNLNQSEAGSDAASPVREITLGKILAGVKADLGLKKLSPSAEREWFNEAEICVDNGFTAGEFLECLSLLRKQKWRTGRIAPATVTANLPELEKLRAGIAKQNDEGKPKKWYTEVPEIR